MEVFRAHRDSFQPISETSGFTYTLFFSLGAGKLLFKEPINIKKIYIDEEQILQITENAKNYRVANSTPKVSYGTTEKNILSSWDLIYLYMSHWIIFNEGIYFLDNHSQAPTE